MKKLMSFLVLFAAATLLGVVFTPGADAQSEPQRATFTLTEPLEVGTTTLQPGTYLIKVVLIDSNRDMLQVSDPQESKVYATILSRPHPILMSDVVPESRYVTWATPAGEPRALRTWYFGDRSTGHDIIYSRERAMQLAAATKETVIAVPDSVTARDYSTAPFLTVTPDRQVKPYDAAAVHSSPKPAPVAVAEARPSDRLPKTASRVPLVAALGLVSLGGAFGLRAITSRSA